MSDNEKAGPAFGEDVKIMPTDRTTKTPEDKKPEDEDTQTQIRELRNQIASLRANAPLSMIPEHAAGVGDDVAQTWSQYEQELAMAGEHPDQPQPK